MSELKVNKISPRSGTDVTLGDSGDTFTVPAGASIVNNGTATGFGATVTWDTTAKTANFTAVSKVGYFVDTTSGAITVTLPATPSAGDIVGLVDYAGTFDTNNLTIDPNGEDIEGGTNNLLLTGEREGVVLIYVDSTQGWLAISGINEGTDALEPITYSVDFLVVAGGASGGKCSTTANSEGGGGGGAGGFRTSTQTVTGATVITVTVGDGGALVSTDNTQGNNGSNSSISGSGLTTITSTGGGGGGNLGGTGSNGGSGGGGGADASPPNPGGLGNTPSTSPSQGNNGGNGVNSGYGGGGGGAGAVGSNAVNPGGAGNGGNGTSSSITGSSITYAGGGGGGTWTNSTFGSGGSGGGGAGGSGNPSVINGVAGTTNLGAGGGGGGGSPANSGAGGKGVVILSMPLAKFSGTVTGSPTESDDGTTKRLVFNGSGSYTA
jgi:hypothetical protein